MSNPFKLSDFEIQVLTNIKNNPDSNINPFDIVHIICGLHNIIIHEDDTLTSAIDKLLNGQPKQPAPKSMPGGRRRTTRHKHRKHKRTHTSKRKYRK